MHANEFNTLAALYELYNYAFKYNDQLIQALEEDEFSSKQRLAYKLEQVGFEKIINRHEIFFFSSRFSLHVRPFGLFRRSVLKKKR